MHHDPGRTHGYCENQTWASCSTYFNLTLTLLISILVTCLDSSLKIVKLELNMDDGSGLDAEIRRMLADPVDVYENTRV